MTTEQHVGERRGGILGSEFGRVLYISHARGELNAEDNALSSTEIRAQVRSIKSNLATKTEAAAAKADAEKEVRDLRRIARQAEVHANPASLLAEPETRTVYRCGLVKRNGKPCMRRVKQDGQHCKQCTTASAQQEDMPNAQQEDMPDEELAACFAAAQIAHDEQ